MTESVEADNKLLFCGLEWSNFAHWELSFLLVEIISRSCRISFPVLIFFRVHFFFFDSCIIGCLDCLEIFDGGIKCAISETVIIDQRYGQVRTESRHSLVVHALFTHDLLDVHVLERGEDVLFNFLDRSFFSFGGFGFFCRLFVTLVFKNVVSDTLRFIKASAYQVFVVLGGMSELNYFGCLLVQVISIQGIVLDLFLWILEVTDVAASSPGMLFKEVSEMLQFVIQVLRLIEVSEECLLSLGHFGLNLCMFCFSGVFSLLHHLVLISHLCLVNGNSVSLHRKMIRYINGQNYSYLCRHFLLINMIQ